LVVPDLRERAKRYLADDNPNAALQFMRSTNLGKEHQPNGMLGLARSAFGASAHLWMWDAKSLAAELARAGFTSIRTCKIGDASDPMFARVEHPGRFRDLGEDISECALEACKPITA
jgi:hypothetical protein